MDRRSSLATAALAPMAPGVLSTPSGCPENDNTDKMNETPRSTPPVHGYVKPGLKGVRQTFAVDALYRAI